MDKNIKYFIIKSILLIAVIVFVTFLFRFPMDYFHLRLLSMDNVNRLFSKGDALKVLALTILFFALYYKERIAKLRHEKHSVIKSVVLILAGIVSVGIYYFLRYIANVNNISSGVYLYIIMIASLLSLIIAFALFTIGIFSFKYLKEFYFELKKPLWITLILAIIAYNLLMFFQGLWPFFSYTISKILFALFNPLFPTYLDLSGTPILDVDGFSVSIGAPCSGIESLFLFAAFSIGIYLLDHKKIKHAPFIIFSIIGIIGIYFVNILRLFLLILTGLYVNPDFAVGLFHTNVGWILFVIYFLFYYYIMKKFIYK
jgi:exosortase/archaeosortase family protein